MEKTKKSAFMVIAKREHPAWDNGYCSITPAAGPTGDVNLAHQESPLYSIDPAQPVTSPTRTFVRRPFEKSVF
jgi:hypothetical protein